MNPLLTIKGTLAVGFILALAVAFGMGNGLPGLNAVIWLHVLAGVVWIGMLYYFNFVQVPAVANALKIRDRMGLKRLGFHSAVGVSILVSFVLVGALTLLLAGPAYTEQGHEQAGMGAENILAVTPEAATWITRNERIPADLSSRSQSSPWSSSARRSAPVDGASKAIPVPWTMHPASHPPCKSGCARWRSRNDDTTWPPPIAPRTSLTGPRFQI